MRDEDQDSGRSHARHVARVGHSKSGGHVSAKAGKSKGQNQIFQDPGGNDPATGGDGPYNPVEYPKHVTVDGTTHVARDEAHEAELTKGKP